MITPPCAICGKDTSPRTPQQLGPGEPSVFVCSGCDSPVVARDDTRGYEVPERARIGPLHQAFSAAANRVAPLPMPFNEQSPLSEARPGFRRVRVVRRQRDRVLDANEARETLRGKPWFGSLNYVGTDAKYHLFDRPEEVARPARSANDVLGELAEAARKAEP
jgi:hypothetical protein